MHSVLRKNKNIIFFLVLLLLCGEMFFSVLSAGESKISVGLNGSAMKWLTKSRVDIPGERNYGFGGVGGIDFRYTAYSTSGVGIALGFGAGMGATPVYGKQTDRYSNYDYDADKMDYTVRSIYRQTEVFAKLDFSILMAVNISNVIFNLGPRLTLPIAIRSNLRVTESVIDVYFPNYGITVLNERVTGWLETPHELPNTSHLPSFNVLFYAELGYEFRLDQRNGVGIVAFVNLPVWNDFQPYNLSDNPLVSVSPIWNRYDPVPQVTVNNLKGYVTSMRYLDFGLRVYYSFTTGQSSGRYDRR